MHFKDIKLSRRPSPEGGDARPSTPGEAKSGRRGRPLQKGESGQATDGGGGAAAADSDLAGRPPKRSNSFGLGLGGLQSLASGMHRAGESLSRKTTGPGSDGNKTPPITTPGVMTTNSIPMGPPILPDSSHLAQFSLKLSELVNKSFMPCTGVNQPTTLANGGGLAGAAKNAAAMTSVNSNQGIPTLSMISYEGKKLPSKVVVMEIAKTVVTELEYAHSVDPYLLRAVSRSALKALTLFANRIDSLLVPNTKDSTFVPSTAKEGIHIPAGLEFNLGLVTLEWIVEDALERCIEGPPGSLDEGMPHFVSDILTPVRKKMEGTILHVIKPVISNVKAALTNSLSKAVPTPFSSFGQALSPVSSASAMLPDSGPPTPSGLVSPGSTNASPLPSQSWLRELEGRLEGSRRLLVPRIEERCGQDGEGWFISVAIHLIWKGLLILTSRAMPMPPMTKSPSGLPTGLVTEANKRSPSPAQLTNALKSVSVKPRKTSGAETPSGQATPASVSASAVTNSARATASQVQELQAFEKLVLKFASGFEPSRSKPSAVGSRTNGEGSDSSDSDDDDDEDELARAALAEALQAIKSTILVIQHLDCQPDAVLEAVLSHKERSQSCSLPVEVIRAAKATPPLLLLHLVYARMPTHLATFGSVFTEGGRRTEAIVPSPPGIFGYSWLEYERAIAGFAGGQSWAHALVDDWKEDLEEARVELEAREKKLSSREDEGQTLTVGSETFDPADSTPTPESVLLRRTASTRSAIDSSDSLPDEMTASAPTLDREKVAAAGLATTATAAKSSAWPSLKKSLRAGATSRASEVSDQGTHSSPDVSPPQSPFAGSTGSNSKPSEAAKTKRFWRTNSTQGHSSAGFHLTARANHSRTLSPASLSSPTFTEEQRAREEMRMEREGVRLLKHAIDVVEAVRKPGLA